MSCYTDQQSFWLIISPEELDLEVEYIFQWPLLTQLLVQHIKSLTFGCEGM